MNRETYLNNAVTELAVLFEAQGYELPPVNVSCSWPGGGSARTRIGECWSRAASKAEINEIFISPIIEDSIEALDILTHELIHAVDDCQHGHRKEFTAIMRAIGLEGKPTATHAGERLHAELVIIVEKLGTYPHKEMHKQAPKQKSRQLKAECDDCGAVWRMSSKWLSMATACPCCQSDNISIN